MSVEIDEKKESSSNILDKSDEKLDNVNFSHEELIKLTKSAIDKIIDSDPLFSGLPLDATVEEIKAQTAVAQGQAITLYLNRGQLPRLSIVIPSNNITVLELKKAIRTQTSLALHREKVRKKISWRHVWKKYNLLSNDIVLKDDNEKIKNYDVINRSKLNYVKKLREKNRVRKFI